MNLLGILKKLIGRGPPPAKFLTPDGKPREPEKQKPPAPHVPTPYEAVPRLKPFRIMYLITKSNFGGAQRYVYDLASHMPPDAEAIVLCGTSDDPQGGLLVHKLAEVGVRSVVLPELARDIGFLDFVASYKIWKILRAWKPDVLHLNSSKAGVLGVLAGRLAGVPKIIFTSHGWPFNEKRNIFWRVFVWFASVFTILLSSKVICVSTYDRNQFRGWFFSRKLVGIRNALPPGEHLDQEDVRHDLVSHSHLYKDDIWVGTIAELNQNKNIELGIRAVAKAREAGCPIFYAIVGDGELRFEFEDLVKELKMDQNIKLLGFISDAPSYIKAFDLFLLPSRKEGLPYVILEAQKAGVPVIASAVGGIPEMVHDGENGVLFQSENLEQLTAALIRLCKDQEFRTQLAKPFAPQHFETMLRETFAQYR